MNNYNIDAKLTKKAEIQRRVDDKDYEVKAKQAALYRQWDQKSNSFTSQSQIVIQENNMVKKDVDVRRQQLHQINLQRRKMQQKEYKALLVDKLQVKDMRASMLQQRKTSAVELGTRLHA